MNNTFDTLESEVRSYIRLFPAIFEKSEDACMYDVKGNRYIDFFAGAGVLNYGHNNPKVSNALIRYIQNNGIIHSLDMATSAKKEFLEKFSAVILKPRNLNYKIQFTGPTGTNAVEAAVKLSRIVKKRSGIIAFTNSFHGLTAGSLSLTAKMFYRSGTFVNRSEVAFMPYDNYFGQGTDTAEMIRTMLTDPGSGVEIPAAIILETLQAEGGINIAGKAWLQKIRQICTDFDILMIVDDIQVGNGRTGRFFSFEDSEIVPDMVLLSKSLGGGLPMSVVLIKPEYDMWEPGKHTGTFRGNNLAFVAATELLSYCENNSLSAEIMKKGRILKDTLQDFLCKYAELSPEVRGKGLIWGLKLQRNGFCREVSRRAFQKGLIIETAGAHLDVLKFMPPLTIDESLLSEGLEIINESVDYVMRKEKTVS